MSRERNGGSFRATRSPSYSRSRSRSYSKERRRSPSPSYHRRRSPSPFARGRPNGRGGPRGGGGGGPGFQPDRINPEPSTVLGIFGLSPHTREKDLKDAFSKYGKLNQCRLIIDKRTMKSRGFGFVYYDNIEDAKEAKRKCHGMELDGKNIRVDFSIGERDYSQLPPSRPPPPPPPYGHHGGGRSHYHSHHHHARRHSPYGSPSYHGNRGRERDSPVYSKRYSRSRSRSYDRHYHRRSSSYRR